MYLATFFGVLEVCLFCWGRRALVGELLCHINFTNVLYNLWGLPRYSPASTVVRENRRLSLTNFFYWFSTRQRKKMATRHHGKRQNVVKSLFWFLFCSTLLIIGEGEEKVSSFGEENDNAKIFWLNSFIGSKSINFLRETLKLKVWNIKDR